MTTRQRRRKPREETSAGGVVFRRGDGGPVFLLIRDSYANWGFPKGHLEEGEDADRAALREVAEETGLAVLRLRAPIETIEWNFRFRGRLIHKVCHFYLIETPQRRTKPQREEGITACRWASYEQATKLLSYENARLVLDRAHVLVGGVAAPNGAAAATPAE